MEGEEPGECIKRIPAEKNGKLFEHYEPNDPSVLTSCILQIQCPFSSHVTMFTSKDRLSVLLVVM